MNFDHEELTLMMLYNSGTRLGLVHELRLISSFCRSVTALQTSNLHGCSWGRPKMASISISIL